MRQVSTTRYYDGEKMRTASCPEKSRVLAFMRSVKPDAVAAGYFEDAVTGETMTGLSYAGYTSGVWTWDDCDAYHFEKYDLELEPEFIEYALSA